MDDPDWISTYAAQQRSAFNATLPIVSFSFDSDVEICSTSARLLETHRFKKSKYFATSGLGFTVDVCFLIYESEKSKYSQLLNSTIDAND
jgi:hypothetical protein